jgi:hypothetical protein
MNTQPQGQSAQNLTTGSAQPAASIQPLSNYRTEKRTASLDAILQQQAQERGLSPLPLETELLLKRIEKGGHSGQFLAAAFLSAYRKNQAFNHSLMELINLDAEGFRLFHQCLHIRHVSGWNDEALYQIEKQIKRMTKEGRA